MDPGNVGLVELHGGQATMESIHYSGVRRSCRRFRNEQDAREGIPEGLWAGAGRPAGCLGGFAGGLCPVVTGGRERGAVRGHSGLQPLVRRRTWRKRWAVVTRAPAATRARPAEQGPAKEEGGKIHPPARGLKKPDPQT